MGVLYNQRCIMKLFNILNSRGVKIICSVIVVIYVAITAYSQHSIIKESERILASYKEDIKKQEEIALEIENEKSKLGTDEYIEKVARDKLGMCKEDEKIFVDGKEN